MQIENFGLRDRRRNETLRDLHVAAVDLAREGGLAAATVEAITDRAGVSRRTFFNYYPTKEDALLATTSPAVSREALDRFLNYTGDDTFGEVLKLVIEILTTSRQVDLPLGERMKLVGEFPSLKERLAQHVSAAEEIITVALDERSTDDSASSPLRDPEAVKALLMLASTVMRFAHTRNPEAADGPSADAIQSAIAVFRTVFKEIS